MRNVKQLDRLWQVVLPYVGLSVALAALIAFFGFSSKNFFQLATLTTIANQIPELTFVAIGMTLVLVTRGIDLSVGSLLALASAVMGVLMVQHHWSLLTAFTAAAILVVGCGTASGVISTWLRIPSFIVTLGMLEIARGQTKLITNSQTVYIGRPVEWFGDPINGLGVSPAFVAAILAVLAAQFLLMRTVFGRYCVAIGTNAEVVRMSGIRTWPYAVSVFSISGLCCAFAAWAQLGRMPTADPNAAVGMELSAIAACVIGGTSLMGGRASVVGTLLGVLTIQVLQTGLAQLGVRDENKQIITGLVIVLAVTFDALNSRRSGRA